MYLAVALTAFIVSAGGVSATVGGGRASAVPAATTGWQQAPARTEDRKDSAAQSTWDLPATIDALRDVSVRSEQGRRQERGVLYIFGGEPFTLKKGERFRMLNIHAEGQCTVDIANRTYRLASCPWLDGFSDHQADVFKVVSGRAPRARR